MTHGENALQRCKHLLAETVLINMNVEHECCRPTNQDPDLRRTTSLCPNYSAHAPCCMARPSSSQHQPRFTGYDCSVMNAGALPRTRRVPRVQAQKSHPHHLAFMHVCKKDSDSDARGKLLKRKVENSLRAASSCSGIGERSAFPPVDGHMPPARFECSTKQCCGSCKLLSGNYEVATHTCGRC